MIKIRKEIDKMARTNMLDLSGMVLQPPKIAEDKGKASFILVTIRGRRETGSKKKSVMWDLIPVNTKDPEAISIIEHLDALDIVRIKGVLVTKPIPKSTYCENCGTQNTYQGVLVYAEPIYIEKTAHASDEEAARDMVFDRREVSNEARVVGTVFNAPSSIKLKSITACQYQLAINRTYRIKGSSDDDKADFPWIKSYGKNAIEDCKRLRVGSSVLIDGCIQSREQKKTCTCENCQVSYDFVERVLEIVPYETEYLRNYITDEELGVVRVPEPNPEADEPEAEEEVTDNSADDEYIDYSA